MKIVVHGKQSVGFQLPEHTAQLLFNPVHSVKEVPAVHFQLSAE
jgi:hypothetical protein